MHYHHQNLNEHRVSGRTGSILRHGRAWIRFTNAWQIGWEWSFFRRNTGLRFDIGLADYECALSLGLSFFIASFHYHLDNWKLQQWIEHKTKRRDVKYGNGRELGFYTFERSLWIKIWSDPMESRSSDPWYCDTRCINFADILFGKQKYSTREIEKRDVQIPMPEGCYPATVTIYEATWARRWWFPRRLIRANIDMAKPIPVPGKGENSWDCGDDATHGLTCLASSIPEAVAKMVETCLKTRLKYGGYGDYTWARASA